MRWVSYVLAVLITVLSAAWGALAIGYQCPGGSVSKWVASLVWCVFVLALLVLAWTRRSWLPFAGYALAFLVLMLWWGTLKPSNTRVWSDDVAQLMTGTINGNQVTLHNVRNFNWRTDEDYDSRWETRNYDLDRLASADLVLSSWGVPAIAHAMISFGFEDGSFVVFSVEIRKQRGQAFSAIGGFFKAYEQMIIAADEHDIIRVRTNVRGEDDHLYRLQMSTSDMRALFIAYVDAANRLARKPEFYNSATSNCTTLVYRMAKQIEPGLPLDSSLLLTGRLPQYLYRIGALDKQVPLDVLTEQGHITSRALASKPDEDFSRAIRAPIEHGSDGVSSPR